MDEAAQEMIEKSLEAIGAAIKLLDTIQDPVKKEAIRKGIEKTTAALRKLVMDLVKAGAGPHPKGVLAKALAQVGIHIGKASGAPAGAAAATATGLAKVIGFIVSAIAIVLTSPSEIGGHDREVIYEFVLREDDQCFRIQFVRTKRTDELLWDSPRLEWEEISCPDELSIEP